MTEQNIDSKRTPRDILRVVFRRRHLFLLGAAISAFGILIAAHWAPLKYTGTSVFERRGDIATEDTRGGSSSFSSLKLTLEHELSGYNAVDRAVEDLELTRGLPHGADGQLTQVGKMAKQELVYRLMKDVRVSWDVRTDQVDLVSVSFTSAYKDLAENMTNTLMKNYIEKVSGQITHGLTESRDFLAKKVKECNTKLEELDRQRTEFESKHAGMMPDSPNAIHERIQQTNRDIDTLRHQQTVAKQTLTRLRALIQPDKAMEHATSAGGQPVAATPPEIKKMEENLQLLKDDLENALTMGQLTERHPTVRMLKTKIATLEYRIALAHAQQAEAEKKQAEVDKNKKPDEPKKPAPEPEPVVVTEELATRLAVTQSELEISTAELERLQNRLAGYEDIAANFGPVRQEYLRIVKELNDQAGQSAQWEGRLTEVQMQLAAEVAKKRTHLNAVQLAQKQYRPSSPQLLYVIGFAIIGALAFGGGLVFLTHILDRTIVTTEDASQHFGIPIHAVIGEIVTERERRAAMFRKWIVTPSVAAVVVVALAISSLSLVLWLRYPEKYDTWRKEPVAFVYRTVADSVSELLNLR